jgi:hypothetical protein
LIEPVSSKPLAVGDMIYNPPAASELNAVRAGVDDSIFPKEAQDINKIKKGERRNKKLITAVVSSSLIVALLLAFVILPKAVLTIYAKTEPVTRDLEISFSPNIANPDSAKLILPAMKVAETTDAKNKFQSQGKKEVGNKATGFVRIYNFTREPINLKVETTVITLNSRNYLLTANISYLMPVVYKNAKTKEVDEKSLAEPVEVVAEKGGDSYNLPAGTRLEITNKVFGSRPQLLYAKTDTPFGGGTSRFLSYVTEQDLAASKTSLKDSAIKNIRDKLAKSGLVLPDKAFTIEELEFKTDRPVGTETPGFEASGKVKVTGLAINKADLEKLVTERIRQTLANNKTLQPPQPDALDYQIKNMDFNTNLGVLSVHFEDKAVYEVNLDNTASQLVGKGPEEVNEILNSKTEIEKIDVSLSPFWQKSFPYFKQKIIFIVQK